MTLVHKAHLYRNAAAMDNTFLFVFDAKNMVQSSGRYDQLISFLASHCLLPPSPQTLIFNLIKWEHYMVIFVQVEYICMNVRIGSLKKPWC